ncbi:MipA/OmpV family protein [Acinetobacter sp. ANC 4779]|uniref:MipA/OmpV family protein n=1 Tax=Acinetobacter sp. ANC 4779 TaxID=2529848 RepID=UPI00103CFF86|nr:MipA/OmpV family protein [Acinetobacter sp. ANC 4779]TCB50161.1 MipA/OmpV family protein [Acinetobacter sp. ANC 4779]
MLNKILLLSCFLIPLSAIADENQPTLKRSTGLSTGLGIVGSTGLYIGEDTNLTPVPILSYEGDRFFLRGLYGGMKLYKNELITLNGIVSVNLNKLDVDDLNESKLAAKNLTKMQLEDRDISADVGLEAIVKVPYGIISVQALNDIGNASDGAEVKANYQYFWRLNNQWTLMPNVGLEWLSDSRANYYYGTLDSEVAKGVEKYRPNNLIIPHVSLGASYSLNQKVKVTSAVTHKFLPDKIVDDPLIDKDSMTNFFMGITYKF